MPWTSKARSIFRSLLRRNKLEADLDAELRYHLAQETESNIRSGMTPELAKFAAQRLVGSITLYKEQCRDARHTGFIDGFIRDLRYAIRMSRRAPLFTAAAIATLALGIGANTTVFTFVENIILRSLPVPDPQQLVSLNWGGMNNISYPNYIDFRDRNTVFSNLLGCRVAGVSMSLQPRENFLLWGYEATGNYFEALGITPLFGRFFGPAEDNQPGAHPILVISEHAWRSRFA